MPKRKIISLLALVLAMLLPLNAALAWVCPGCEAENNGKFCIYCGQKRPVPCCPDCGAELTREGQLFCANCGASLVRQEEMPVPQVTEAPALPEVTPAPFVPAEPEVTAAPAATERDSVNCDGVTVWSFVILRDTPSLSGMMLAQLDKGMAVYVMQKVQTESGTEWYQITANGVTGYVLANTVELARATEAPSEEPAPVETEAPAEVEDESTFEIIDAQDGENGAVTVTWSESVPPYSLSYAQYISGDFYDDALVRSTGLWYAGQDIQETTFTIKELAPGCDYWFLVMDAENNLAIASWEGGEAPRFDAFDISVEFVPLVEIGTTESGMMVDTVGTFSAAEILEKISAEGNESDYGAYICLNFPAVQNDLAYAALVVLTAPGGEVYEDYFDGNFTLETGLESTYWNFYSLNDFFYAMWDQWAEIPTGTYTWSIYLDGMLAGETTFEIGK